MIQKDKAKIGRVHSAHGLLTEAVDELFKAEEIDLATDLQEVQKKVTQRYKDLVGNDG